MTAVRYIALLVCSVLACIAMVGCANGEDGRKQACANADTLLVGGYQLATASIKDAAAKGTAKKLYGCFADFVAALDAGTKAKETACSVTRSAVAADVASAMAAGATVATAVANWKACSVSALGGL